MSAPTDEPKHYVSEQQHMLDGFRLGRQIYDAGFRPSFIVGLWRGGSAVGIVVQECLATLGVATDHISLRTSYRGRADYQRTLSSGDGIRVHGRQYLLENLCRDDSLLIVDDVFSSGRHAGAVVESLRGALKRNMPEQVRVAVTWWRRSGTEELFDGSRAAPDFYVHETTDWLVLPYEMRDLTLAEIAANKPFLVPVLERAGLLPAAPEEPPTAC